jgi:hypothetical protein
MYKDGKKLLSEIKFLESYSRKTEDGAQETWDMSVSRIMNMHREFYKNKMSPELEIIINDIETAYKNKVFLGSQRALQFGGEQLLKHHSRLYNCVSSVVDRPAFFGEIFYWLLAGAGAGFAVYKKYVNDLPRLLPRTKTPKTHIIEDSIEGWATSLDVLLASFFEWGGKHPEFAQRKVYFDFTKIRPEGAMISGGFKAPGPEPLRAALNKIENILISAAEQKRQLKPIEVYDIVMHASDAVLSGGVRRSATICIFDADDEEMMNAKIGNWYVENPQRGRSNNSAAILRNETTKEQFDKIFKSTEQYGEPGFIFVNDLETTFNPCVEIGMHPFYYDDEGKRFSGWQGCVSYDTKLITRDGIHKIGNLAENNKEVEIWNGVNWSKVKPIKTGENRILYRVKFSDGSYLDATENHKFLIKNRFEKDYSEKTTLELVDLLKKSKYNISVPRTNINYTDGISEKYAYDYGFILGDGTVRERNGTYDSAGCIYESNFEYNFPLKGKQSEILLDKHNEKVSKYKNVYYNKSSDTLDFDNKFAYELKYNPGLPNVLFTWDKQSILNFIAGWIDTDGTITASNTVRIYGEEEKIRDCQLLLTKIGIQSSVNLMSEKGTTTNKGVRNRDVWYVQIMPSNDLWCSKKTLESKEYTAKGKYQNVKEIIKLENLHDSYCFEEFELHQGLFNNVLTKQCNLTEINGSYCDNEDKFLEACYVASAMGTLQAGYTDFKFVDEITKKIFDREALLGVSITGWMSNPRVLFDDEILRKGANLVKEVNKKVAKLIEINPAARTTTVKPSGNASVLLGTTSGIHGEHSEMYIRNIQLNKNTKIAQLLKKYASNMIEESVWSANKTDYVASIPVVSKKDSIFKLNLYGIKLLEYVKLVQNNWVNEGTDIDLCVSKSVRHNVSNTVQVDNWEKTRDYIWDNKEYFAGISLLSMSGDKDYNQAPFSEVLTAKQISDKYGVPALFASGLIVDALKSFDNNLWLAIDTANGYGLDISEETDYNLLKRDWVRRFKKFAEFYYSNDLKMTEYCLKDVYLLHKWTKIQMTLNIEELLELLKTVESEEKDINTMGAQACFAGQCEI